MYLFKGLLITLNQVYNLIRKIITSITEYMVAIHRLQWLLQTIYDFYPLKTALPTLLERVYSNYIMFQII